MSVASAKFTVALELPGGLWESHSMQVLYMPENPHYLKKKNYMIGFIIIIKLYLCGSKLEFNLQNNSINKCNDKKQIIN